jgi:hypothetical protein
MGPTRSEPPAGWGGPIASMRHDPANQLPESANTRSWPLVSIAYWYRSTDNLDTLCMPENHAFRPPQPSSLQQDALGNGWSRFEAPQGSLYVLIPPDRRPRVTST